MYLYLVSDDGRRYGKLMRLLAEYTGLRTSCVGYHVPVLAVRGPQPELRARFGNGTGSAGPGRARRRTLAKRAAKRNRGR